ncbi:MAG TPA: Uma2 family endonuclease [Gammaproteobacteria bacterium]|nr:Uma2 family endonuclease [Gammaproteobacteria bacterium]
MIARAELMDRGEEPHEDHYVHLYGVTWADYLRLLEIRGERSAPRITYLEGTLEIMSPSRTHDEIKSYIGRLVEAWCLERGVDFTPYGSWTLKNKREERGAEADECYIFGPEPKRKRSPDLMIDVIWTAGGIDKLDVYRKLGVGEVWFWEDGRIRVYVRRRGGYDAVASSEALPGIDLEQLVAFLDRPSASRAIRDYRAALGAEVGGRRR